MIFIGLGANLPSPRFGPPRKTLEAAMAALESRGIAIRRRSRFYESAPVPASDQPWFVNAVIGVSCDLGPQELMAMLLEIERCFGRLRTAANAARVLDLDLIAYDDHVSDGDGLTLPHPRMQARAFVLLPLAEIAPDWRHPVSAASIEDLIAALPAGQTARVLSDD